MAWLYRISKTTTTYAQLLNVGCMYEQYRVQASERTLGTLYETYIIHITGRHPMVGEGGDIC